MGLLSYALTVTVMMRVKPELAVPGEPTAWSEKLRSLAGLVLFPVLSTFLLTV